MPVVQYIFCEYLTGRIGLFAIAETLTRLGIPSPSAYAPERNPHRCGIAWTKGAVKAILHNPRYTGRQVWNKQRKEEVLLDVENVALGHVTRMRWNAPEDWVWSNEIVHVPLVSAESFQAVHELRVRKNAARNIRHRRRTTHSYAFRGLLFCGICGRRMQGQRSGGHLYYRCRFPSDYALANEIFHPRNVYLNEQSLLPPLDRWLALAFALHRLDATIKLMHAAQAAPVPTSAVKDAARTIAECDAKLARYRKALEAGTDPELIARWTAEVQARRAEAEAQKRQVAKNQGMTKDEIRSMIKKLGPIREVPTEADLTGQGRGVRERRPQSHA